MIKPLLLAALFSLAVGACAQASQYPNIVIYERAAREPHLDTYTGSTVHYGFAADGSGYYYCDVTSTDFFTVQGSLAQGSLPWGTTWKYLTDPSNDHWTYSQHVQGSWPVGKAITIKHDYYTIDHNYKAGTPDADPSNGDDVIKKDGPPPYNSSWVRTCTSSVTNNFYGVPAS